MENRENETEDEKWGRFSENCPMKIRDICWCYIPKNCKEKGRENCELWYARTFE